MSDNPKESAIERRVTEYCKRRGYYCRKLGAAGRRGNNGLPDRIICHGGKAFFLELKRLGERPTPLQQRELNLLTGAGMRADWADSYEEAVQLLEDWFVSDVL